MEWHSLVVLLENDALRIKSHLKSFVVSTEILKIMPLE
jgi:hypothetical protein